MAKRYLGYGYTNAQGVAKLEYDSSGNALSHSYTGVGAGKVDIVAESGSLQSETYSILDCTKCDTCTTSDSTKTTFDTVDANSSFTRYSEYGELTEVNTGTTALLKLSGLSSGTVVEFEVYQVDGVNTTAIFAIYSTNTYKTIFTLANLNLAVATWHTMRLTLEDGKATLTDINNTSSTKTNTFSGTANQLRFSTGDDNTKIRIRNLKVYPV